MNPDWSKCPYCGSENIEAESYGIEGNDVWFPIWCHECTRGWFEVYMASHREDEEGKEIN